MASIESQAENDFITGTLLKHIPENSTSYSQVYIGGVQFKEGGYTSQHWRWTDGSLFGFTNWASGNYDLGGNENYMTMITRNPDRGTWNDVPFLER